MKFLYDLVVGEMIHIYVLVEQCYCIINWSPPPTKDSPNWGVQSVDLLSLAFLISMNLNIALVIWSREPPFFFFPLEWTGSAARFSTHLPQCPSTDVGSSSTSSPLSDSTFTCTLVNRNATSSSHSLSLFEAG